MKFNRQKVAIAMSGGVDSSVAAYLLKKQGYDCLGLTMCFGISDQQGKKPLCCGLTAIRDARKVCDKLGIRHVTVNFSRQLQDHVIKDFVSEYSRGRTPNPCILCNQFLKFGELLKKARSFGVNLIATGHYARIERSAKLGWLLKKGKDKKREQSYFLASVSADRLGHILFPLGGLTKEKTRRIAKKAGLSVHEKKASQEICFVSENDYRKFLVGQAGFSVRPGAVYDVAGKFLGNHKGIGFYTVGQRQGLGISSVKPLYIVSIDSKHNTIIVGEKKDTFSKRILVSNLNLLYDIKGSSIDIAVKIRYNQPEVGARLKILNNDQAEVIFKRPVSSVAPGQAAVFYKKDIVAGQGVIEGVLK